MLPSLERIFVHCGYRVPFYNMISFSLYLSKYLNRVVNKWRHANDFQDGGKCKMAATFHSMSYIEHIVKYCNTYRSH